MTLVILTLLLFLLVRLKTSSYFPTAYWILLQLLILMLPVLIIVQHRIVTAQYLFMLGT